MDLAPAYSFPLDPAVLPERSIAAVPPGRQRLLGVDFDIGGVVMLSMAGAPAAALGLSDVSVAVAPPRPRFDALHLLMAACCPLPGNPRAPYAYVVLRYVDGGEARMSILHRCDLWLLGEEPDHAAGARIAWVGRPPAGSDFRLYAPRLANPHPGRDVASIAFEASEHFASGPMVFAATIEQADRAPQPAGGE